MRKKNKTFIFIFSLFFFILDQFLKWQSLHTWNKAHLLNNFFGWQPFLNSGIAFGLPLPNWITISFTILVLITLIYLIKIYLTQKTTGLKLFAMCLIISGAISNLTDRLLYSHTIDYLLVFTTVINIADCLIVIGFTVFFLQNHRKINL